MAIDLRVKFRRTARNSQELYASCGLGKTSNAQTFNGGSSDLQRRIRWSALDVRVPCLLSNHI